MSLRVNYLHYVSAGAHSSVAPIPVNEVLFFWADDACTVVVTATGELRIHTPLYELLPLLDPRKFWQVQRNTVINSACIERVTWKDQGQVELKLKDRDERILAGHPYCAQFREQ